MRMTRRQFTATTAALTATLVGSATGFAMQSDRQRLGLNTYSFRTLLGDGSLATIIQFMKKEGLKDCQLYSGHVEPSYSGLPASTPGAAPATPDERKAAVAAARSEWRLSAPLADFEKIRSMFEREGLRIRAYGTSFGSSAAELDKLMSMARALGAETVNGRLPEALTDLVAAAAEKHRLRIGIQVTEVKLVEQQLRVSPLMRADPDTGDLAKLRIDALEFVKNHLTKIDCVDLKDAIAGDGSVAFGDGAAQLKEVLELLSRQPLPITAYVDCDYPGTGQSVEEVSRCVAFARQSVKGL